MTSYGNTTLDVPIFVLSYLDVGVIKDVVAFAMAAFAGLISSHVQTDL